ncbi:hypothetical protein [Martelella limonii]|uniref:hypothetical protein n=1 Tax=Martelella limonii TaxID=1647649 RepID=UPI0015812AC5|nr:hypothetical protein [Martelella limonii]
MLVKTFTDMITFTRAGAATYIDAGGLIQTAAANQPRFDYTHGRRQLLLEGPATNLLLNSAVLATQSVTVTNANHVLSFYGSGSVTLTGAYSGVLAGAGANDRSRIAFSAAAGTLTITVSGDVRSAQLELGSHATSYVPTAGSAVTRPADKAQLTEPVVALLRSNEASFLVQFQGLSGSGSMRIMGAESFFPIISLDIGGTLRFDPSLVIETGLTQPTPAAGVAASIDRAAPLRSAAYNGGSVKSSASSLNAQLDFVYLGRDRDASTDRFANGWYDQLVIWPFRMTDADLQAKAVPYA